MSDLARRVRATAHAAPGDAGLDAPVSDLASTERLGVEEEFHVVDLATRELVPRAPELLALLPDGPFTNELHRSVVETNSPVCTGLDELREALAGMRRQAAGVAEGLGLGLVGSGTVPLVDSSVLSITDTARFRHMRDEYQILVREQLICGTQVHVDLPDRDVAVAVTQRLSPWLPVLLALSASSPYWLGTDSGYASARSLAWQRWPTSGGSGATTAAEHDALVADLVASGTISDPGMIYFDVRISPHLPTLELRVTDACPDVDDVVLLAGLFRALVRRERDAVLAGLPPDTTSTPLLRAAMWRAARAGLEGDLLDLPRSAGPVPAARAVEGLLEHTRTHLEAAGDWEHVAGLAEQALARGSSAAQQRRAFERRGRFADVVDLLVARTQGAEVSSPAVAAAAPLLTGYRSHGDEAVTPDGAVRDAYAGILGTLEGLGSAGMLVRERLRDDEQRSRGVTFGVPGEASTRLFPVDLLPRVVPAQDWADLRAGLVQRADALDAFLHDVYGERAAVRDGVIPGWVVEGSPGLRPTGVLMRRQAVRAHVSGMDLVRNGAGEWSVLEDNLRVPSGIGYAMQNRRLTENVLPELVLPRQVVGTEGVARMLRETLEAAAPPAAADRGPVVAVISDGPTDSAWFEHSMLAEEMGVLAVQPRELVVTDGAVFAYRSGVRTRLDVLYLRVGEDTLLHSPGADGVPLAPTLVAAVDAGTVGLANGLGNGIGDDKAIYAYVGAFIAYYLGEEQLLADVPTYLCGVPEQCEQALGRMAELVFKPVDGYGGEGVLIGPHASQEELDTVGRQVRSAPHRWIAQEVVDLSTVPCFDEGVLAPRHVDLRAFVLKGERTQVAPVALTRVAPAGSLIVNSSRGGGSKDTWLLSEQAG